LCDLSIAASATLMLCNTSQSISLRGPLRQVRKLDIPHSCGFQDVIVVQSGISKRPYILKKQSKAMQATGQGFRELMNECEILKAVDSRFVMGLVDTHQTKQHIYALFEYCTGVAVYDAIRVIPSPLSRQQAAFYIGCVLLALEALGEQNIVHRDVKPEILLLDGRGYPKLTSFDIAKKLSDGQRCFTMAGTPHYMPPEMMRNNGQGTAGDLWSLGCLAFEFVCGFLPFGDECDAPADVFTAVLTGNLVFPQRYRDAAGKMLISGLLERREARRMSAVEGQRMEYFCESGNSAESFFKDLTDYNLPTPFVPEDSFQDPLGAADDDENVLEEIELSDTDEDLPKPTV